MKSTGWLVTGVTVLAIAAWTLPGCSSDDDVPSLGPAGAAGAAHGGAGAAGAGATGGKSSAGDGGAGAGGAGVAGAGGEVAACNYPLGCAATSANSEQCPATPEALPLADLCRLTPGEVYRFTSSCGGTIVEANYSTHFQSWTFDAANELTGRTFEDDVSHACSDGSKSRKSVYGTVCQPQGEKHALCNGAAGQGGDGGESNQGGAGGETHAAGAGGEGGAH